MSALGRVRTGSRNVRRSLSAVPTGLDWRYRANLLLMVLALLGGFLSLWTVFPESWWQDRRFAARAVGEGFSEEVVVVALDEHFAERHDRPDPTPREYLARVLAAAVRYEPSVIAFDFRFGPSAEEDPGFEAFRAAAQEAAARGVAVLLPALASWPDPEVVLAPPSSLGGDVASGLVSFVAGGGRGGAPALRSFVPVTRLADGRAAPSLGFLAAAAHRCGPLPPPPVTPRGVLPVLPDSAVAAALRCLGLAVGHAHTPLLLDYAGAPTRSGGLTVYSSEDFLERAEAGSFEASWVAGRVVLVGATYAREDYDTLLTPYGTVRGAMYHVYTVDTLLRGVHRPARGGMLGGLLAVGLFLAVFALWFGPGVRAGVLTLLALGAYVVLCFAAFAVAGLLLPVAPPLYGGLLGGTAGFVFHRELRGLSPLPGEDADQAAGGGGGVTQAEPTRGSLALRRIRAWLRPPRRAASEGSPPEGPSPAEGSAAGGGSPPAGGRAAGPPVQRA